MTEYIRITDAELLDTTPTEKVWYKSKLFKVIHTQRINKPSSAFDVTVIEVNVSPIITITIHGHQNFNNDETCIGLYTPLEIMHLMDIIYTTAYTDGIDEGKRLKSIAVLELLKR